MRKRNILLLVSDHHRGDWLPYSVEVFESMGIKFIPLKMPTLEKLMKEGTSFNNCTTPSPLCAPARACLASGRDYEHCGVGSNRDNYPVDQRTFYSVLKEGGYSVGGVGKFDLHKPDHWWGLDGWVDDLGKMGFTTAIDNEGKIDGVVSGEVEPKGPYMKYLHDKGLAETYLNDMVPRMKDSFDVSSTDLPEEAYCDNWITDNAVKMISKFGENQPWFLQVNFAGPHGPWDITKSMKERWANITFEKPVESADLDLEKVNGVKQNFAAMLENIDANIAKVLAAIEARGELKDTLIIYTSDHGELLGDKGGFGKCRPEFGSISIPLVIHGRDVVGNRVLNERVELHDLTNTIIEYAGCEMPEAKESESLKALLEGTGGYKKKQQKSGLTNHKWHWKMMIKDDIKYIYVDGQLVEQYDLTNDRYESENLLNFTTN